MDAQQKAKLEFEVKYPTRMYRLVYHYELPPNQSQMPFTRFVVARSEEDAKQAIIKTNSYDLHLPVFYSAEDLGACDRVIQAANIDIAIYVTAGDE